MPILMSIFCILSMACASFLFLRRLHAVYATDRIIRSIFTFLWIGVTVSGTPMLIGFHMEHIPGTNFCTTSSIKKYVSIIDFFPAAFDTLVFLAISYKVAMSQGETRGKSWGDAITGKTLPQFSRAVLHSGQQYYLSVRGLTLSDPTDANSTRLIPLRIVFGITIVTGATLFAPGAISSSYHPVLTLISTTLTASMACRTFRNLKAFQVDHLPFLLPQTSPSNFSRPPPSPSEDKENSEMRMVTLEKSTIQISPTGIVG